jgi:hypothetical protein
LYFICSYFLMLLVIPSAPGFSSFGDKTPFYNSFFNYKWLFFRLPFLLIVAP